ncbi:MAG: hypothetical protein P0120_14640 [Nitrospira sp.]|nr:hypothetical protein [Nitrospira sp.]
MFADYFFGSCFPDRCFESFFPQAGLADGFRNPFHDAAAIAQGNAFAAQADNASAVFYNPAAMTHLRNAG